MRRKDFLAVVAGMLGVKLTWCEPDVTGLLTLTEGPTFTGLVPGSYLSVIRENRVIGGMVVTEINHAAGFITFDSLPDVSIDDYVVRAIP